MPIRMPVPSAPAGSPRPLFAQMFGVPMNGTLVEFVGCSR